MQIESKSNTGGGSRPSAFDSPRSSSSVLTSGDDSVMPHHVEAHVEQQYEMLMPLLPHPSPYWRYPNATEAYRASHHRSASGRHLAAPTPPASGSGAAPPAAASPLGLGLATDSPTPADGTPAGDGGGRLHLNQHSIANAFVGSSHSLARGSATSSSFRAHADGLVERVTTDDSGMQLRGSTVRGAGGATVAEHSADELAVRFFVTRALTTPTCGSLLRSWGCATTSCMCPCICCRKRLPNSSQSNRSSMSLVVSPIRACAVLQATALRSSSLAQ